MHDFQCIIDASQDDRTLYIQFATWDVICAEQYLLYCPQFIKYLSMNFKKTDKSFQIPHRGVYRGDWMSTDL